MAYNNAENIKGTDLFRLAEFFKVFSDPTRLKLIYQISRQEKCVGDIARDLNISESTVSHHFQVMKMNGIVKRKRIGKSMFYSLQSDKIEAVLLSAASHIQETRIS